MEQRFEYIGWVPCVSGRLFFEYTECGLGSDIKVDINHIELSSTTDGYQRFVVISSTVDWKDGNDDDTHGEYRVVFTGSKTSEEISLSGNVYLVPNNKVGKTFQDIDNIFLDIRNAAAKKEEISDLYNVLVSKLDSYSESYIYKINYVVESPGFTKLRYVGGDACPQSHKFTVCRQAYYYIKYLLHKHRHHHNKAESLTTIHSLDIEQRCVGIKLLNDLRKSLVQIKRDSEAFDGDNLFRARGIASYAMSLAESCHRVGYLTQEDRGTELKYFESIKSSVEVMADAADKELARSVAVSGNARAVVIFVFSVIAPLIVIFREDIRNQLKEQSQSPEIIINFIAASVNADWKILFLSMILLSFILVYVAISKKFGTYFLALQWYRKFLTLIFHENEKGTIFSFISIAVFLMMIFYAAYEILAK